MLPKKEHEILYPNFDSFPAKVTADMLVNSYLEFSIYGARKFLESIGCIKVVKPYFVSKERLGEVLKINESIRG